jgi:hypothetical protein
MLNIFSTMVFSCLLGGSVSLFRLFGMGQGVLALCAGVGATRVSGGPVCVFLAVRGVRARSRPASQSVASGCKYAGLVASCVNGETAC